MIYPRCFSVMIAVFLLPLSLPAFALTANIEETLDQAPEAMIVDADFSNAYQRTDDSVIETLMTGIELSDDDLDSDFLQLFAPDAPSSAMSSEPTTAKPAATIKATQDNGYLDALDDFDDGVRSLGEGLNDLAKKLEDEPEQAAADVVIEAPPQAEDQPTMSAAYQFMFDNVYRTTQSVIQQGRIVNDVVIAAGLRAIRARNASDEEVRGFSDGARAAASNAKKGSGSPDYLDLTLASETRVKQIDHPIQAVLDNLSDGYQAVYSDTYDAMRAAVNKGFVLNERSIAQGVSKAKLHGADEDQLDAIEDGAYTVLFEMRDADW